MALTDKRRDWLFNSLAFWLAGISVVGSLYASYLQYNVYPLLSSAFMLGLALSALCLVPLSLVAGFNRWLLVLASGFLGYAAVALSGFKGEFYGSFFLAGFVALKGRKMLGFTAIMFLVIGLTTPLRPAPPTIDRGQPVTESADLPPLIHLILDEHGPADYGDLGFSTWSNARSTYSDTRESLQHVLLGYQAALKKRGYALEIWQSDYFQFCHEHCLTYRAHAMDVIRDHPDRDRIAFLVFLQPLFPDLSPATLWSLNGHRVLDMAVERAQTLKPGQALFLHALVPHHPYVMDEQCRALPLDDWKNRHSEKAQDAYRRQAACVRSLVARLPDNAIVIIHGDHGNRLTGGAIADDDYAAHRTLFAIRNGPAIVHPEPAVLRDLLVDFVRTLPAVTDGLTPPPQAP